MSNETNAPAPSTTGVRIQNALRFPYLGSSSFAHAVERKINWTHIFSVSDENSKMADRLRSFNGANFNPRMIKI
jgi:hypothetical protein